MIKPLIKSQNQSEKNHADILTALQERIDLFGGALKGKNAAMVKTGLNHKENTTVQPVTHVASRGAPLQLSKHAQANGAPVQVLPNEANLLTQESNEGLSDMKHFNRVRYFMNEEKGYLGCSIVAICKSIRFYFVMLWDRTITVKALKEFCIKVKEDFNAKINQFSSLAETPQEDSKHSGAPSNLDAFKGISKILLEKMAKSANSFLKKKGDEDDNPVTIVGELFNFINPEGSKIVDNNSGDNDSVVSQSKTQTTFLENVTVNHDKPYSDALVLVDMDGCMAVASNQGVMNFIETVKDQVLEEGSISIGSFSRRSIVDEVVRAFRLPKPGSSFKQWQLFGTTPGNCENEFGYGTLDSKNPSPPHMQFPRLDTIVDQCNKSNASNNSSTVSVSDFVIHDLFQGDHDQKKSQLRQVVRSDTVYSGAVANTLRSWMTPSDGKNQEGGVLAEMQDFFSKAMKYGDITFEDLCAAFVKNNMSHAQEAFFSYLWCYNKIISNDSGEVIGIFELASNSIAKNSMPFKDITAELDIAIKQVSSLSLPQLKVLSLLNNNSAYKPNPIEEAEIEALYENDWNYIDRINESSIRSWFWENHKSIKSCAPLCKFIQASNNLKTQFDNWSPNGENSNSLNVKSMQNDDALKAWFALIKDALIESLGEMSDRKLSNKLVHNSMNPVELAGPSSNGDKVLQLLASMWEDYSKTDNKTYKSEPSKLLSCVDDDCDILENTHSVMKKMLWAVPPHVEAIRFYDESSIGGEVASIDEKFMKKIDCTQSDKEVRQKIADHYMSDQGLGVPGLVQDLMDVISSKGKAGWDPKVNEKSTSKQRMYVLCKQDNKGNTLNHDASNTIYSSSGIKTFTDAAKEKIYDSHVKDVDAKKSSVPSCG